MLKIPRREGERPETTNTNPHEQLTQNPNTEWHERFKTKLFCFDDVSRRPSIISVPGAEALWLNENQACNCTDGFMIDREFAHVHPAYDGSLHMALSATDFQHVIEQHWGEKHPLAGMGPIPETVALVYAPRNDDEIGTVLSIVQASLSNALKTNEVP
ncbi:MAG: hypothetical protein COB26_00765 [Piscirickettsiaceae bacterium]|nr:MAG: hypothetical protein COB26_02310 [Piscirickettsiaceae bacterium]PCI71917.1 MAG: hypothetical protein COB26_00765 [Piscirickettsiaceae bacterium]